LGQLAPFKLDQAKGQFFSAWRFVGEIGQLSSPVAFAFLVERYSYGSGFAFLALTSLGTALVLALLVKETIGRSSAQAGSATATAS